jgi:glycosyltransferase involved in cell wall biosynthesis
MLSILIRSFDDPLIDIVSVLHTECQFLDIEFEILISDDDPNGENLDHHKLSQFSMVTYWRNKKNLGRSNNLNKLIRKSKFNSALLMDADVIPLRTDFIKLYLEALNTNCVVAYGGLAYEKNSPEASELLRWVYGHKEEAKPASLRQSRYPYNILVSNLLLKKSEFEQPIFNTELNTYGYEDLVFSEFLKEYKIEVMQIDNPVIHKGLETSMVFLQKTETALDNLVSLIQKGTLSQEATSLSTLYFKLRRYRLNGAIYKFLKAIERALKSNLVSNKPSLIYFKLYKLYHFSKSYQKR